MTMNENERWEKVRRIWEIIDRLRGESGCPWDRKQTPESVQTYLIEEAHEAAAAVRTHAVQESADELGDLLFMVFFLIHLYEEKGEFGLAEVCDLICQKMIRRHPHVFSDATVNSTQEVRDNWEKIKADEKASAGKSSGVVPESLPALMRAYRMVSRLSHQESTGWNDLESQLQGFALRSSELSENMAGEGTTSSKSFGDLLLDMVNLARLKGLRAEDCLHETLRSLDAV